ncbi:hypothetical protein L1049_003972 [Liquidambar formosana]|uniref:Uncharacterized protein n=1 Tax=Liquidambar formosana TaxID=63359 RepID=A0AAP0WVA1_LIQFO
METLASSSTLGLISAILQSRDRCSGRSLLAPQSLVFTSKMKAYANGCDLEKEKSVGGKETPVHTGDNNRTANVIFAGKKINGFQAASVIDGLFADVEVSARTSLASTRTRFTGDSYPSSSSLITELSTKLPSMAELN